MGARPNYTGPLQGAESREFCVLYQGCSCCSFALMYPCGLCELDDITSHVQYMCSTCEEAYISSNTLFASDLLVFDRLCLF